MKKPYRYVIFSDQHKGTRDIADDFQPCEATYLAALDEYKKNGYTLIEMGDVEELWENDFPEVMQAYTNIWRGSVERQQRVDMHDRVRGGVDRSTWQ